MINDHNEQLKLFDEKDTFLTKLKVAKKLTKGDSDSYRIMIKELSKKIELSNHEKMMIKHKALTLVNSLLEMQKETNLLKKLKKDMDVGLLKEVICQVYSKFSVSYKKKYGPKCLNHFDPVFMKTLKKVDRNRAEGVILETGFYALFIILRLYKHKGKSFDQDNKIFEEILELKKRAGKRKKYTNFEQKVSLEVMKVYYNDKDQVEEWSRTQIKKLKSNLFKESAYFFYFYSSMIEITRDGIIEEIFFIRYPYVNDLQKYDKDRFNRDVERSSTKLKVNQLMEIFEDYWTSMKFNYALRSKNKWISLVFTNEGIYLDCSFFIVFFFFFLIYSLYL